MVHWLPKTTLLHSPREGQNLLRSRPVVSEAARHAVLHAKGEKLNKQNNTHLS